MAMAKRMFFFFITNIAVIATISIIVNVFGLMQYIDQTGINYPTLMMFCVVWGMGGALISLFLSKMMVKMSMGVRTIDPRTATGNEAAIVDMVRRMSTAARIPMPEVGIYDSPEVNAFATGATKKSSLVAVSTGLLENMSRDEVEGVVGHEVSHIANGDMVTMVLIQGVVNAFALFLSRILSYAISMALSKDEDSPVYMIRFVLTIVFDIVFSILGSLIVAFFSRIREFGADYGSAKIAGKQKMIGALRALQRLKDAPVDERGAAVASLKIGGKKRFISLFSTHPALEDRIAALEKAKV